MAYESKIQDTEIIQGDSSPIYFFGHEDDIQLNDGNWVAKYTILTDFGTSPIISRDLPLNSGTGTGDTFTAGTRFVFQITPDESAILTAGEKYIVSVEISNSTIPYKSEIAQYKLKVKPQGVH